MGKKRDKGVGIMLQYSLKPKSSQGPSLYMKYKKSSIISNPYKDISKHMK